jgi:hypothetical protein
VFNVTAPNLRMTAKTPTRPLVAATIVDVTAQILVGAADLHLREIRDRERTSTLLALLALPTGVSNCRMCIRVW